MSYRALASLIAVHLAATLAAAGESTATLHIVGRPLHPVSENIFGQFLERPSWDGESGPEAVCDDKGRLPAAVEKALKELHTPMVRFPVGTDGDYIDWQDMADLPGRAQRPATTGHRGGSVTNRFGFPEYFELAGRMGWKTILVSNLRDALYQKKPLADAASHSAALLAYGLKHAAPGSIAAFQIGNEGWFFWPPKPDQCAALGIADDAAAAVRLRECLIAYADAARAVDPSIPLICDGPRPADAINARTRAVWLAAVDHPDVRSRYAYLAAHAYSPLGFWSATRGGVDIPLQSLSDDDVWFGLVATPGRFDGNGQCLADSVAYDEIAALGFRAAVTEWNWNGWDFRKQLPQVTIREGVAAALGSAGFLHGMLRHPNIALATQSMMLGTKWGITSVRVLPDGGILYNPQAEPVRLYAEHHGSRVVESRLENAPVVLAPLVFTRIWPEVPRLGLLDAVVTESQTARYVHVINRDRSRALPLDIILPSIEKPSEPARWIMLSGDVAALSTSGDGRMIREERELKMNEGRLSATLPPATVSVLILPKS